MRLLYLSLRRHGDAVGVGVVVGATAPAVVLTPRRVAQPGLELVPLLLLAAHVVGRSVVLQGAGIGWAGGWGGVRGRVNGTEAAVHLSKSVSSSRCS